jgi:hypothetical protein
MPDYNPPYPDPAAEEAEGQLTFELPRKMRPGRLDPYDDLYFDMQTAKQGEAAE